MKRKEIWNNMGSLLPWSYEVTMGQDIISIMPNENFEDSIRRHLFEQRTKKIMKIRDKMKKGRH